MANPVLPSPPRHRGFTLIEVMVVVVIVAILASIALPSYRAYVVRTHENVAKAQLSELASLQQSFFNDRRRFAAALADLNLPANGFLQRDGGLANSSNGNTIYQITVTDATAVTYTLSAAPIGAQATDSRCGTLSVTQDGTRDASGPKGDACWQ